MSDIEKIEAVLCAAAEIETNLDSEHARKILAERIKNALDKDDTDSTMGRQWEEVELCGDDMTKDELETVSEIIYDALFEKGIYCEGLSWSVNVEYFPQDNLDD